MDLTKLNPWNWFKHEDHADQSSAHIPVTREKAQQQPTRQGTDALLRLHQEMDQLFDDVFNAFGMPAIRPTFNRPQWHSQSALDLNDSIRSQDSFRPQIDVSGDEQQYEITLDVPGLSAEALSIELKGDVLTVQGDKEEHKENQARQFYRIERRYGAFQRTLSLPDDADKEAITAKLQDGVLTLTIPRKPVAPKDVKRISISS
ncbi:Hsp20/alpha crystallin family protein [Photobacterium atrarenae]|uniref:Hsp20/alpha crystallin family protein n=1 Tax=Photobacterium atrarenae TaxID=865757 RepID=A0ABY5GEB8_9GAMM|nr:Hsp20/alpha crystallin family protein [Photobacterium atrarenae]UTV26728.1 Hsp20/alpha crystallin family protein [Photobacterium atrarenae]